MVPAERIRSFRTDFDVTRSESPESVSVGDDIVQFTARSRARGCRNVNPDGHAGDGAALKYPVKLRRHGPGLPGIAGQRTALILAALVTVYIVLGVLYESYIHPITILSTLPSAGVGAVLALLISRTDLTVIAVIGIILLIGIVKKNGIMMVDFALEAERRGGMRPEDAIYQASLLRFRPIMMTTMAALLGALPLALGGGVGSEFRRPLGISIAGGLIFSQMLTLYTTPVIYLYLDRLRLWLKGRRGTHKGTPGPVNL